MTRARLIEKVIEDWLAADGEFDSVADGWADASDVRLNYTELAKELDRELERIIRETSK